MFLFAAYKTFWIADTPDFKFKLMSHRLTKKKTKDLLEIFHNKRLEEMKKKLELKELFNWLCLESIPVTNILS